MHVTRERPEFQGPRAPILPPLLARSRDERPVSARRGRRTKAALAALALIATFGLILLILKLKTPILDRPHPTGGPRLSITSGGDLSHTSTFGLFTAYFCASLYLGSRLPQFYHNYSRSSVQGLSISLFVLATAANICYVCSILTSSRALNKDMTFNKQYFKDATPFLITAGGAMAFDQVILGQWVCTSINRLHVYLFKRQLTCLPFQITVGGSSLILATVWKMFWLVVNFLQNTASLPSSKKTRARCRHPNSPEHPFVTGTSWFPMSVLPLLELLSTTRRPLTQQQQPPTIQLRLNVTSFEHQRATTSIVNPIQQCST